MRPIRASDISAFLYCQRAWWYRLQGLPSENQGELLAGSEFHQQHSQRVLTANLQRLAAWALLLMALVLLAIFLTLQWLG